MSSSLEERLKNNSSAFDGLLSLIPAKYYYDDDTQEQWKAKKMSKDELKQNKRAKLDPEVSKDSEKAATASQVQKKRAQTAKPVVIPGQKKIQPIVESDDEDEDDEEEEEDDSEQSEPEEEDEEVGESKPEPKTNGKTPAKPNGKVIEKKQQQPKQQQAGDDTEDSEEHINVIFDDEGNEIDTTTQNKKSAPIANGSIDNDKKKEKKNGKELTEEEQKQKEESLKALKEKLQSKINNMREKRKAPGANVAGAPSSREAILEERRKKAELKAEKKRKLAEMQKDAEDSGASDDDESDGEQQDDSSNSKAQDGVIFQNIVFDKDSKVTSDLQNIRVNKKKGPAKKDLKAHLKLIEQKKQKIADMDDDQKKELAEKEKWNKTLSAAEGHKFKDDEKLLKKALKRKEAQKRKSEVQWQERKDHVQNMITLKAKRREENLEIRKQNKGVKRKNQTKQLRKFKTKIAPKRAGFEGRRSTGKK